MITARTTKTSSKRTNPSSEKRMKERWIEQDTEEKINKYRREHMYHPSLKIKSNFYEQSGYFYCFRTISINNSEDKYQI